MLEYLKKTYKLTCCLLSSLFLVLTDTSFESYHWINEATFKGIELLETLNIHNINIGLTKISLIILVWSIVLVCYILYIKFNNRIFLKGDNFVISIEYGDLFKSGDCKRVISFDECYTTTIGKAPYEIQITSICGQYLEKHPELKMQNLIEAAKIKPARAKSAYGRKDRYESGTIVPNDDDLLMAFVKLDTYGRGRISRKEYIDCLFKMWEEIDLHKGEQDVCIPIIGSGVTHFDNSSGVPMSPQELVNIILMTYQLSPYKVKPPHKLRIICKRGNGFDLNDIDLNLKESIMG